jgi:hypothetical protein
MKIVKIEVKLLLCLINYYAINMYEAVALYEDGWPASRPGCFIPAEKASGAQRIADCVVPGTSLQTVE